MQKLFLSRAFALVFFVLSGAVVSADVIELKNGQKIEGLLKQADQATVIVEVGGQLVTLKAEQVKAIYYGSAAAPTAAIASSPSSDAVRVLQDLNSVVTAGVSYDEYGRRVSEANIAADRYLGTPANGDAEIRTAVRQAVDLFNLARKVWNNKIRGQKTLFLDAAENKTAQLCPGIEQLVTIDPVILSAKGRAEWHEPIPTLWACAAQRIKPLSR